MSTKLDIFSDPICPWCYIGKARLWAALEQRPDHPFVIEWHPFMLNPAMPPEGMDRREYLVTKFGGTEGLAKAYVPIQETAEALGLPFNLGAIERTPSTLDAHRLIHWAGLEGRQNAAVDGLFKAYFVEGRDIGDRAVLTGIAGEAGLDAAMIARLLDSDADREAIQTRDSEMRARGLGGVPAFIIGRKYVVQGAQPTEVWLNIIDELAQAAAAL